MGHMDPEKATAKSALGAGGSERQDKEAGDGHTVDGTRALVTVTRSPALRIPSMAPSSCIRGPLG